MKLIGEYQLRWLRGNFHLTVMYAERTKHPRSLQFNGIEIFVGCHLSELSYLERPGYDRRDRYTLDVLIVDLCDLYVTRYIHRDSFYHLLSQTAYGVEIKVLGQYDKVCINQKT